MSPELISIREFDNNIVKLECYNRLDSTTKLARAYARDGYPDRYAVVAEYLGSSDQRGMYMSIILRPSIFPSQAGLLSSLATVALVNALEEHTTKRLGIGWVSNVFCEGEQVGSVSIEGKLDNFTSYEYIIVTFSVTLSDEDFPPKISDLIKKVFSNENNTIASIIAKNVVAKFFPIYSSLKTPDKFMALYMQKFILTGTKVKLLKDGKRQTCKVLGINPKTCALLLEGAGKTLTSVTSPASVMIPKSIKIPKK